MSGRQLVNAIRKIAGWSVMAALTLGLAAGLGACGKKGDLDPPESAKDRQPRTYPKPQ